MSRAGSAAVWPVEPLAGRVRGIPTRVIPLARWRRESASAAFALVTVHSAASDHEAAHSNRLTSAQRRAGR